MEIGEKNPEKKIRYKNKNVFVGENSFSGKPIFEKKKVPVITPKTSIDIQPSFEEHPPVPEGSPQEEKIKFTKVKPKKDQDPLF